MAGPPASAVVDVLAIDPDLPPNLVARWRRLAAAAAGAPDLI